VNGNKTPLIGNSEDVESELQVLSRAPLYSAVEAADKPWLDANTTQAINRSREIPARGENQSLTNLVIVMTG
jgi:hypothetical protein